MPFYQWAGENKISEIVREYIDSPADQLLNKNFTNEKISFYSAYDGVNESKEYKIDYKLIELFKAADRRFGKEKLLKWSKETDNPKVFLILLKRFGKAFTSQMSFRERAIIGMELLSKQPPVTFEQAQAQVIRLKNQSSVKNKKQRN